MRLLLPALLALLFTVSAQAQTQTQTTAPYMASAPLSLELFNARWFDGTAFKRGTLYVVDGKFTATKPKRVNRRMDLNNQFLVSPLAEAHNYNLQNEWAVDQYAQRYMQDGVFYAAMLCAEPGGADAARAKLDPDAGPDVLFVTDCVTSGDGQPLGALADASPGKPHSDFVDKTVVVIDKPEDIERKWPLLLARKSAALRLMLVQSDHPELHARPEAWGRLGLTPELATALTQRAHQAGIRVIAHVETAADFANAVKAGVDWIDHVPGFVNPLGDPPERFAISPEVAAQAAQAQIAVVTGTAAAALFKGPPDQPSPLNGVLKRNLQTLKDAGVTLLLGSDVFTDTAQAELRALADTGVFSNAELLKMATINTPRALFPKRRIGCFEPGCEASFLLLAADPLSDLKTVATPLLRVKQGRLLTQSEDVAENSDESSMSTEAARRKISKGRNAAPRSKRASKAKSSARGKATGKTRAKKPAKAPAKTAGKASVKAPAKAHTRASAKKSTARSHAKPHAAASAAKE